MRRTTMIASLAILLFAGATTTSAFALVMAVPSGPAKVVMADVIVEGRVVNIQEKSVEATVSPNSKNKVEYKIALVQVGQTLKGKLTNNLIKIGFQVPRAVKPPVPGRPNVRPVPILPGRGNVQLQVNQEGLFFLRKHHDGDFYTLPMFGTFVSSSNQEAYKRELDITKSTIRVLDNPMEGLKSNNPATRLETASTLVTLYRTPPFGSRSKQVPISAEESQLILKAMAEASWDRKDYQGAGKNYQLYPYNLFSRLGIGPQDGFQRPKVVKNINTLTDAAQAWVKENWRTYRIQKYVATQGGVGGPVEVRPVPGGPVRPPIQIQPIKGKIKIQPINGKRIKKIQIQPNKIKRIKVKPGQVQPRIQPIQGRPVQIFPVVPQPADVQPNVAPAPQKD